jgi:SAM-dependent methyltransferase
MNAGSNAWRSLSDSDFAKLDLRQFMAGPSPYGPEDQSLDRAFSLGRTVMRDLVCERVRFVQGRVLDLLSGAGRWLPFLADANEEVVAIERLDAGNLIARNLCAHFGFDNVRFAPGDITEIEGFSDTFFDYVWMWSGLQYVERAYALKQIRRVLKPGGRVFIGAYNATGLMVEHVLSGAESGTVFDGAAQWALSALARGSQNDGNPNFIDIEGCSEMCERFGLSMVASAPQSYLDLREDDGKLSNWQDATKVGRYFRTVEFVAQRKPDDGGPDERRSESTVRRMVRRLAGL